MCRAGDRICGWRRWRTGCTSAGSGIGRRGRGRASPDRASRDGSESIASKILKLSLEHREAARLFLRYLRDQVVGLVVGNRDRDELARMKFVAPNIGDGVNVRGLALRAADVRAAFVTKRGAVDQDFQRFADLRPGLGERDLLLGEHQRLDTDRK